LKCEGWRRLFPLSSPRATCSIDTERMAQCGASARSRSMSRGTPRAGRTNSGSFEMLAQLAQPMLTAG
jgi:hypothetical protein